LFHQKKGKWVDELPRVIWSHNTTVSRATGFTPFRLLFGTEAMTPEEIKNESMRVLKAIEIKEVDCRRLNLSTSMGGTRSKVEDEDRHDLEPEGTREDTRQEIYTGSGSRSSYPMSCLE
jgi:hypothetical protein